MADRDLQPHAADPLLTLTALIFGVGVLTCFDELAARIPAELHTGLLWLVCPLLLVAGYYESRTTRRTDVPTWMQIQSRPLRWALTLGFTYPAMLAVQALDWELGPIDPSPPLMWPLAARAAWFLMFTLGMSFANSMVATAVLVPALRVFTWPVRRLPEPLAVLLALALGLGLDLLILWLAADSTTDLLAHVRSVTADPTGGVLAAVALMLVPALLAPLFIRRRNIAPSADAER